MNHFLFLMALCLVPFSAVFAQEDIDFGDPDAVQTVLIAKQEASIASPFSANITQLPFYNGDFFDMGETLVAFNCDIEKAQRDQAKARLESASATLNARKKLEELSTVSRLDLLKAEAEAKQAQAEVEEFEARLTQCDIKAPYDGRVIRRDANPHETVKAGELLISIASLENMQAQMLLPSSWLNWIKKDTELEIHIRETGKVYPGYIVRIGGAVDPVSQSVPVIAELNDYYKDLLPGMTGIVHFKAKEQ